MEREREEDAPVGRDPEAERGVEKLEDAGERLEEDIRAAKRDWEAKQDSDSVPGAVDPDEDAPGR